MKIRLWLMAAGLIFAAYLVVFGGEYSFFDMQRIEDQRRKTAAQVDSLRARVDSMRRRARRLENDPEAIERVARERYGMIHEGERLYRFVPPSDSVRTGSEPGDSTGIGRAASQPREDTMPRDDEPRGIR